VCLSLLDHCRLELRIDNAHFGKHFQWIIVLFGFFKHLRAAKHCIKVLAPVLLSSLDNVVEILKRFLLKLFFLSTDKDPAFARDGLHVVLVLVEQFLY